MATTFRNALLVLVLILGLTVEMKAQDRYEYATIVYTPVSLKSYSLSISEVGYYKEETGKLEEGNTNMNFKPLLNATEEMAKQGWEVYSTYIHSVSGLAGGHYYHLRRKLK